MATVDGREATTVSAREGWLRGLGAELRGDLGRALRSGPVRIFLAVELVAVGYQLLRRGPEILPSLAVIALGACLFGPLAWLAGRHPWAHPAPDPVRAPRPEALAVGVAYVALAVWMFGLGATFGVFQLGLAAWALLLPVARYRFEDFGWLVRTWQPYLPLFVAIAAPKALILGADLVPRTLGGLQSGITQQLLLQVGLTARIEALTGRRDMAAVLAGLGFGLVHVPLDLAQAGWDWSLAVANAAILQSVIGVIFCVAYQRHRAPLGLGFGHALLMA